MNRLDKNIYLNLSLISINYQSFISIVTRDTVALNVPGDFLELFSNNGLMDKTI